MGRKKRTDMILYDNIMSARPIVTQVDKPKIEPGRNVPDSMILDADVAEDSGVFQGIETGCGKGYFVGKRSGTDGNILTVGINGSGKSHVLVKSTLRTWRDPFVVLDMKGELSEHYKLLQRKGFVRRPYITFDPTNGGVHYNIYALLDRIWSDGTRRNILCSVECARTFPSMTRAMETLTLTSSLQPAPWTVLASGWTSSTEITFLTRMAKKSLIRPRGDTNSAGASRPMIGTIPNESRNGTLVGRKPATYSSGRMASTKRLLV